MQAITLSEQETYDFAKEYAKKLKGGEIIGLIGELGAGKTIFTKGLATGLGIERTVTSPTFIILNTYPVNRKMIKLLVHVDAYRISEPQELINIGIEEYFNRDDAVVIIEWADKIKTILPSARKLINFQYISKNKRKIKDNEH